MLQTAAVGGGGALDVEDWHLEGATGCLLDAEGGTNGRGTRRGPCGCARQVWVRGRRDVPGNRST